LADVVSAMEALYPPGWASPGDDAIGLVVGDPQAEVRRILYAVDPVQAVVEEARQQRADLVVAHHPLLFRAVHTVAATNPKGRVVHDLVSAGIGLYVAHTNADSPVGGVSDSMARALGLTDLEPLGPYPADPLDKLITFVPSNHAEAVLDALAAAGAGHVGDYDRCAFVTAGQGTFRPGDGARPAIGTVGEIEVVEESRLEMVLPRSRRVRVVEALRRAHPYEEPAFDVLELADVSSARGTGRVGTLPEPVPLRVFADAVVAALPPTAVGARVSGDLDRLVRRVGLVGGAGDFMLDAARRSGVDAYVTSDLRHHPASELREYPDAPALVDVPHWAAEWTWLPVLQQALADQLAKADVTIDSSVSRLCTDPWNHRADVPR